MRNTWIIAKRELQERLRQRGFWAMLLLGPLLVLLLLGLFLKAADQGKTDINVLIVDPGQLLEHRVLSQQEKSVHYYFIDDYLEINEFRDAKAYQQFDVMLELNEKVLNNKKVFVFFRDQASLDTRMQLKFQVERRMEELLAAQFTKLSVEAFRSIKQGFIFDFRDVYDPKNEAKDAQLWAGFAIGSFVFLFIGIFGMGILRATVREKSNRIVEVLISAVEPQQLMRGKLVGIGLAALLQFSAWIFLLVCGFWIFRSFVFPDLLDPSHWQGMQALHINPLSDLVFEDLPYGWILLHFVPFFLATYFFYGALFSVIGARSTAESDGQQFVIPLLLLLTFSVASGIVYILYPASTFSELLRYLPFSSAMIAMIDLCKGLTLSQYANLLLSFVVLMASSFVLLRLAARSYRKHILTF
ncbi:MAG: hypothetical protein RLZZ301_721 [Bacteroidota bacterium]|jgi:ABC-2 type transport system permease protein